MEYVVPYYRKLHRIRTRYIKSTAFTVYHQNITECFYLLPRNTFIITCCNVQKAEYQVHNNQMIMLGKVKNNALHIGSTHYIIKHVTCVNVKRHIWRDNTGLCASLGLYNIYTTRMLRKREGLMAKWPFQITLYGFIYNSKNLTNENDIFLPNTTLCSYLFKMNVDELSLKSDRSPVFPQLLKCTKYESPNL